jgi:hypothetical protein
MPDKLVTVAQYADSAEASLAQQLLTAHEIKAVLTGQHATDVYTLPSIAMTQLQVLESQAEQARQILESQNKQED